MGLQWFSPIGAILGGQFIMAQSCQKSPLPAAPPPAAWSQASPGPLLTQVFWVQTGRRREKVFGQGGPF